MIKGQRPSAHFRRVGKRKFVKKINPTLKKMTNKQYKLIMKKKLGLEADFDGDGVKNKKDCFPFNEKKQDDPVYMSHEKERSKSIKEALEERNQLTRARLAARGRY